MADIALIFHWQPSAMDELNLSELMEWRAHARVRNGTNNSE